MDQESKQYSVGNSSDLLDNVHPPQNPESTTNSPLFEKKNTSLIRTAITIFAIWFLPIIGILVMWFWTFWPKWLKLLITCLYVVPIILIIISYIFIAQPFRFSGPSMYPNYIDSEYAFFNKINYLINDPQRSEVIIFQYPRDHTVSFTKRIIGLPDEKIKISDGKVYINGKLLEEPYIQPNIVTFNDVFIPQGKELLIPDNNYFVLGDNRDKSSDSRSWGFVKRDEIIGKYWFTYLRPGRCLFFCLEQALKP